jgi:amino acid transporter
MSEGQFIRIIKRKEVLTLSFGAMIGWSWVALTGGWIEEAGTLGAIVAFAVGGITVILVGFTYAELAAAMPKAGGEHVYSYRALGRNASFLCTWAILLAYASVVTFEAVALPTVVEYLVPDFSRGYMWTVAGWDVNASWVAVGAGAGVVMTVINVAGIKTAARVQTLVTVLILLAGVALILGAAVAGDANNTRPLFTDSYKGILGVLVIVPTMMVGFDVIPQSAEEIDLPFEQIGKLLVFSILLALAWYMLIIWGVSMGLSGAERQVSSLPTADATAAVLGTAWGGKLLILGGVGGILTSWNAFLIGGSRAIYALAQAGQLPAALGVLHPRFNTPHRAVILIGVLSMLAPLLGRQALVWLVDAGSFGVVIAYAFVAMSFIVLRYREPDMPRPYKVKHWKVTGIAAFVLSCAILMLFMPFSPAALVWPYEWLIVGGWWLVGLIMMAWTSGSDVPQDAPV